jgi:hypothetical protein
MTRKSNLAIVIVIFLTVSILGFLSWSALNQKTELFEIQGISQTNIDVNTPEPTAQEVVEWTVPADQPRYMSIAAIDMNNARVEALGVKPNTTQMDDPDNPWNVGWYNQSAKPGTDGVGVYDCHTFFGVNYGLCNNLGWLSAGSEIVVERGDGVKIVYETIEVKTMTVSAANEYMNTLFTVPAGASEALSLITCSGTFNNVTQTSDLRTTVRAVRKN